MNEWYGAWGVRPTGTVRHTVTWTGAAWVTRCGRTDHGPLERVEPDREREVPPCRLCVRRLRWIADWWADKHEEARLALEADRSPA